jgi:uncharacterized membrane protein YkvA (DUF1232 family)
MQQKTKYRLSIILGALAALIYIVVPTDLSPDPVPVIGWIDDIIAVLLAITNALVFAGKIRKRKE